MSRAARIMIVWSLIGLIVGLIATPENDALFIRPYIGAAIGLTIGIALELRLRRRAARRWGY